MIAISCSYPAKNH